MQYRWCYWWGAAGLLVVACSRPSSDQPEKPQSTATSAALQLAPCGSNAANPASPLSNGGFEEPALSDAAYLTVAANTPPEKFAWGVFADGIDVCRKGWASGGTTVSGGAYEGQQYLDLVGYGSSGKIAQTVAVTAGTEHTLRFAYANNPLSTRNAAARVKVHDCGEVFLSQTFNHDSSTAEDLAWTVFEANITPKGSSVTLEIESTYSEGSGGILLDGITLSRPQTTVSSTR
jgi:hypothetical protein